MIKKLFKIAKNKYILASLAFIVWVGFVDSDHNFIRHIQLQKDLQIMQDEKANYEEQIEKNKILAGKLVNDIEFVEKYAREEYGMKKDNEVVYVLMPE